MAEEDTVSLIPATIQLKVFRVLFCGVCYQNRLIDPLTVFISALSPFVYVAVLSISLGRCSLRYAATVENHTVIDLHLFVCFHVIVV